MCTPAKIAWEYARVHAVGLLLQKQSFLQPHSNVVGITINPCHCEKKPVVVRQNLSWYQHPIGQRQELTVMHVIDMDIYVNFAFPQRLNIKA